MKYSDLSDEIINKVEYLKKHNPNDTIDIIVTIKDGTDPYIFFNLNEFKLKNIIKSINVLTGSITARNFDTLWKHPHIEDIELDKEVKVEPLNKTYSF